MSEDQKWLISLAVITLVNGILAKISKGKSKMEKDIVEGNIGSVGSYDLEFKQGKLQFELKAAAPFGVSAGLVVEMEADAIIDAIAKAIPGQIDDAIFGVLKAALKTKI